jgi:hypothetical protein
MKKFPIIIILLFSAILMSFSAFGLTSYINACGTLEFNGDYILNQSIAMTTTGQNCIVVTAPNVSINLSGYRITTTATALNSIYYVNSSVSNVYYVFNGELAPIGSSLGSTAITVEGGTILISNVTVLSNSGIGYMLRFVNTNATIVNSRIGTGTGGSPGIIRNDVTGAKFSLFINNTIFNLSSAATFFNSLTNNTILKMFNSIVTSNDLLTNNLGLSTNNESQIVNVLFSSVNTTAFNGYRGLLNNDERGNYYGNAGFGYSDLCDDDYPTPTHDGICDLQYNLSNAVDYFPLSAEGFMMMVIPVDTSFSWSSSSYLSSLPPTYAWDRNSCPVPSNYNYLFCDNFQYSNYINSKGWTDIYNQTPQYSSGSRKLLLGDVTYGVYADVYGTFAPRDVYFSSAVASAGTHAANTEYNTNIAIAEFSFDFMSLNGSSLIMGISQITPDELEEFNISVPDFYYMPAYWDYFGLFYNGMNKGIYVYNFSDANYQLVKTLDGYNHNIKIKIYLYPREYYNYDSHAETGFNFCKTYFTITEAGNTTTSAEYEAGFTDLTLAGAEMPTTCDFFKSIHFFAQNDLLLPIDNVFVRKYKDAQSLNMKVWDCSEMNVPVQQNKGYVNEYPISAEVELNNQTYISDDQGLIDIPNIPDGTYKTKITYADLVNYVILNSTSNSSFRQNVCWFNSINSSVNDTGINGIVDKFGKNWGKNVKLLVALVSVVVVLVGLFFLIPGIPAVVPVVAAMIPFAYFISVGFVPFWVAILLFVVFIAAILLALKGGQ